MPPVTVPGSEPVPLSQDEKAFFERLEHITQLPRTQQCVGIRMLEGVLAQTNR